MLTFENLSLSLQPKNINFDLNYQKHEENILNCLCYSPGEFQHADGTSETANQQCR